MEGPGHHVAAAGGQRRAPAQTDICKPRVVDGVHGARNVGIGMALFFVLCAIFFLVAAAMDDTATSGERIGIYVLTAVTLAVAAVGVRTAYRLRDPRQSPIVALIEQRPSDIAWIYVREVVGKMNTRVSDAMIWKTDGKCEQVRLVPEDAEDLMAELARRAARAARVRQGDREAVQRESGEMAAGGRGVRAEIGLGLGLGLGIFGGGATRLLS